MADSGSHNESCAGADTGSTCHCDCKGARHGEGMTVFRSRAITDRAREVAVKETQSTVEGGKYGFRSGKLATYAQRRDAVKQHEKLSRDDFDALTEVERAQVLGELRAVRDAGDTHTTRDRTYGGVFRGSAQHVATAKTLLDKFTRERVQAPDNSTEGRVKRLRGAKDRYQAREALYKATIPQMREISGSFGFGWSTGWKADRLRNHIIDNLFPS